MIPYYTGATEAGAPQRDPESSTGGFRSGTPFVSMTGDTGNDPMSGVAIREVGGGNGRGIGTLTAASDDSLTWTAPGAAAGETVTIAQYEEKIIRGEDPGAWVRVARLGSNPLSGAHAVNCIDRFGNLFPDVETADAVAGLVTPRALMLLNSLANAATSFDAWIGAGDIEIALETPTAGELDGSGLSWSSATTEGAGPSAASIAAAGEIGLHIRRTIAADSDPTPGAFWEVRYSFTSDGTEYNGAIRGGYRIERTDFVAEGIWVGDGEIPNLEAAPDETWTSRPHTTSLALSLPADIYVSFRQRNKWGMWGAPTQPQRYTIGAGGDDTLLAPSAPTDVTVRQTSGNKPTVAAQYDAAADGDARAAKLWVIWLETDGTEPDGSATPDGYAVMQHNLAVNDLAWTSTGSALDDGTTVNALVRTRRLDNAGGTAFSPDVIQLDDSDPGTLKVDAEISDWDSNGYLSITNRFGRLYEVASYSSISVSGGQTTVTVDARGLWGTTPTATSSAFIITPVVAVDSENTTVSSWEIVAVAPGRPRGAMFFGTLAAQQQDPVEGPDGVTPVVLDAGENVHMLLGEGWASFYIGTTLIWRVLYNGDHGEDNGLYIPSEFDIVNADITGAASGSGIVDAVDANTVYICVRGQRRMKIDLSTMTITMGELATQATTLDMRAEQAGELERFGGTMFLAWDTEQEDYRPYMELDSAGLLTTAMAVNQLFDSSEVEALW